MDFRLYVRNRQPSFHPEREFRDLAVLTQVIHAAIYLQGTIEVQVVFDFIVAGSQFMDGDEYWPGRRMSGSERVTAIGLGL